MPVINIIGCYNDDVDVAPPECHYDGVGVLPHKTGDASIINMSS